MILVREIIPLVRPLRLIISEDVVMLHMKLLESFLAPYGIIFDKVTMKKRQKSGDPEICTMNYYIAPMYPLGLGGGALAKSYASEAYDKH